ncbi:hypothetical protein AMTRI_Chr08g204510 [Amborella trichopoda]
MHYSRRPAREESPKTQQGKEERATETQDTFHLAKNQKEFLYKRTTHITKQSCFVPCCFIVAITIDKIQDSKNQKLSEDRSPFLLLSVDSAIIGAYCLLVCSF